MSAASERSTNLKKFRPMAGRACVLWPCGHTLVLFAIAASPAVAGEYTVRCAHDPANPASGPVEGWRQVFDQPEPGANADNLFAAYRAIHASIGLAASSWSARNRLPIFWLGSALTRVGVRAAVRHHSLRGSTATSSPTSVSQPRIIGTCGPSVSGMERARGSTLFRHRWLVYRHGFGEPRVSAPTVRFCLLESRNALSTGAGRRTRLRATSFACATSTLTIRDDEKPTITTESASPVTWTRGSNRADPLQRRRQRRCLSALGGAGRRRSRQLLLELRARGRRTRLLRPCAGPPRTHVDGLDFDD